MPGTDTKNEVPVDRVKEEKKNDYWSCFEKHGRMNCPTYGYNCSDCGQPNHLKGTRRCRKEKARKARDHHEVETEDQAIETSRRHNKSGSKTRPEGESRERSDTWKR